MKVRYIVAGGVVYIEITSLLAQVINQEKKERNPEVVKCLKKFRNNLMDFKAKVEDE